MNLDKCTLLLKKNVKFKHLNKECNEIQLTVAPHDQVVVHVICVHLVRAWNPTYGMEDYTVFHNHRSSYSLLSLY
jgi:hypothetical protein